MTKHDKRENVRKQDLQEPGSRLQQAANIAGLGHYIWDAVTDRCLFCSEEHARIHGMSVDEYIAQSSTMNGIAHPDDRPAVRAAFKALRNGENFELEYRIVIPSGEVRFIREIGRPVMDDEGVVVQEIGTCQDITKVKQIEIELREKEERLRNAQRIAKMGSWEIDAGGQRTNWSEETARILGLGRRAPDDAPLDVYAFIHADDVERVRKATREALNERVALDMTYRLVGADQAVRTVREVAELSTASGGGVLLATVQDITDRVRIEEKLNQSQKLEAVGTLTGGIAHDFNNLLGVIQGNAELLARKHGGDNALATAILNASERGAELTSRLLSFSRRQPLDPRVVQPGELMSGLSLMLERTLDETIELDVRVPADLWSCLVDPGQLESAVLNLVINARDAMPRGGTITINCENRHFGSADDVWDIDDEGVSGDFVVLSVIDAGEGMSTALMKRCIEPFYTTKEEGKGSGLGLSMVYGFIKQTHGHLGIDSVEDEGTTVTLYLPRTHAKPAHLDADTLDRSKSAGGKTLLILEDDPEVLALVGRMAESLGYKTLSASRIAEARSLLDQKVHFDLLLSDVLVDSDASGPEFAGEMLQKRPGVPVVFMSGYSPEVAKDRGVLGENAILLGKPFLLDDLASALSRSLEQA